MAQLKKYEDFLDRVEELGFMAFSDILNGLPSLTSETPKEIWHTGDIDTDPWCWKDRAAEEKKFAFGCILGGHKGFVSSRLYATFYTAYNHGESMEDKWIAGELNQTTYKLWQLLEEKPFLNTSDIRREMGVTAKKGGSKVDLAIKELQKYLYITVAGSRRKLDKTGQPYGWPVNIYEKVTDWAPEEWLKDICDYTKEEAREIILDTGVSNGININHKDLAKVLSLK